jgi:Ca2+-binding RTX toxin-like protein
LWKLAQGGLTQSDGNSSNAALAEVSKTLIAFAMQKYYTETPSSKGYAKELFTSLTGGVSFDRSDVAATWAEAKGKQYFDAYLQQNSTGLTQAERNVMAAQLTDITQWFVQAGSEGMRASAGPQRSFMLGGKTDDVLSGGDAADLFLGNAGSDTLKGGLGEDVYIFGARHGADVIDDNQGKTGVFTGGRPYKEERPVGAGQNDLILKFDGGDQITIKNYFSNAQTLTRSASYVGEDYELHYGDSLEAFASVVQRLVWQGDGDGNTMTGLSDYANRIESGGGADVLTGGDLDDTLNGGAGEDTYYADAGDFVIDADGQGAVYFGGRVSNFGHSRIALKTAK